jgi:hypothetical protein
MNYYCNPQLLMGLGNNIFLISFSFILNICLRFYIYMLFIKKIHVSMKLKFMQIVFVIIKNEPGWNLNREKKN